MTIISERLKEIRSDVTMWPNYEKGDWFFLLSVIDKLRETLEVYKACSGYKATVMIEEVFGND